MERLLQNYRFIYVPTKDLDYALPKVEFLIRKGLGDEITYKQMTDALYSKDAALWIVWKDGIIAIYITRLCEFHEIKYYEVIAMSGKNVKSWLDEGLEHFERIARQLGADRIRFTGRQGWEKMFEKRGFTKPQIVMQKVL